MEFKIEKDVRMEDVIPKKQEYPFKDMKVGESFLFDGKKLNASNVRTSSYLYCQTVDKNAKFSIRAIGNGEYRCWRVQ